MLNTCDPSDNSGSPPHPLLLEFTTALKTCISNIAKYLASTRMRVVILHGNTSSIVFLASFEDLQLISFPYILNLLQIYLILNNYYSLVKGICYYSTLHSHKLSIQCILINLCQSCINLILFKFNKDQNISKHKYSWEK